MVESRTDIKFNSWLFIVSCLLKSLEEVDVMLHSLQNPPPWDLQPFSFQDHIDFVQSRKVCAILQVQRLSTLQSAVFLSLWPIMFVINFYCSWSQKLRCNFVLKMAGCRSCGDEQKLLSKRSPAAPKLCCIMERTRWGPESKIRTRIVSKHQLVIERWMLISVLIKLVLINQEIKITN